MEKLIRKIKDWMTDSFRRFCAPVSPGTRMLAVVIVAAVFAVANFYILFRAIYNIRIPDPCGSHDDTKLKTRVRLEEGKSVSD
jgi:hypothetical protein